MPGLPLEANRENRGDDRKCDLIPAKARERRLARRDPHKGSRPRCEQPPKRSTATPVSLLLILRGHDAPASRW